jgi:hypothetical protein
VKSFLLTMLAVACVSFAPLAAIQDHCPDMHEDPLGTLDDCLAHHESEIASPGVYRSLVMKALAAQDAAARGQDDVAILVLTAFIDEAEALVDVQITGDAAHIIHHAQMAVAQMEQ